MAATSTTLEGGDAGLGRVCEAGAPLRGEGRDGRGAGGQARTATSAKAPLGSISTPWGALKLPRVVVAPVVMSTWRSRLLPWSCDASQSRAHAERGASQRRGVAAASTTLEGGGARRVRRCGGKATTRGVQGGQARTATSAKVPLGSIATSAGEENCASVPSMASLKPSMPLPARVVTAPVVRSIRRIRWLPLACDASGTSTR